MHALVEMKDEKMTGPLQTSLLVGHEAILELFSLCHFPFPQAAWLTKKLIPSWCARFAYDVFSRNRHNWFGKKKKVSFFIGQPQQIIDHQAQTHQLIKEGVFVSLFALAWMVLIVLPLGDGKKDGSKQQTARYFVCLSMLFIAAWLARHQTDTDIGKSRSRVFQDRYVGRASARSLALMRMIASFLLYIFTLPVVSAPLAETANAPRFMCKPTGIGRLLADLLPAFFGRDALLASATSLDLLQRCTRILLVAVFLGFFTRITAPLAALLWLIYGSVLRAYNAWRGHSFISSWWTLVVFAWRGGAAEAWSLDAIFFPQLAGGGTNTKSKAQYRGWTRFMVTLVLANNYCMAGLSKFCASGIAWGFGINLKAKLMQTALTQTSFGFYLSLGLRHFPLIFWSFLGFCGLYGEIAMGLIPFVSWAKLIFPVAMWGMHIGIILLQHIVFVDLLTTLAAWYVWHHLDKLDTDNWSRLYAGGPWDWRQVSHDAQLTLGFRPTYAKLPAPPEDDTEAPVDKAAENESEERNARSGAKRTFALFIFFLAVWTQGAEWYPWNAFRMFADWTPYPVSYERYVALDANRQHLRNFYLHELNPVLNRKRMLDAMTLCAERPNDFNCQDYLDFMQKSSANLDNHPSYLVVESRSWDFVRNIDKVNFCDEMTMYMYDVKNNAVSVLENQPCTPIDWHTWLVGSFGTI
uniref:HTTM domain-containing protein n=1 Tax=Aureoumbra lagunensis TaxID=44058 RepID=A0A7S3NIL5_9STRA